jgi:stage V sporulation protein AA
MSIKEARSKGIAGEEMSGETLYLKAELCTEVTVDDVFLKDVAKVYCADPHVTAKVKAIKIHRFSEKEQKRQVFSILKLIEMIQQACPNVSVENVGEMDVLVKRVEVNKNKSFFVLLKIIFVAAISFFGTAFTIMAFHNDIGINKVFGKVYELVMGQAAANYTILELAYSIGLALGIIVFFNHIGGRRITKDPTPIEVEMRIYEKDVNNALIETADREGKTIDVS